MSKFPEPTAVPCNTVKVDSPEEIKSTLSKYGVAVIALTDISILDKVLALDNTQFYRTANAVFNADNQVKEPTLSEKLRPETLKQRKAPDAASGFIHQYGTPIHTLIQGSSVLRDSMNTLYNKDRAIYAPNRLRHTRKFKFNDDTLHIEGLNLFEADETTKTASLIPGEVATIVGLAGQRRFVFWDMNDADIWPLYQHCLKKKTTWGVGCQLPPAWMHEHYAGRRRMVTVDCNEHPMLIMWQESTPHEIADSPALSAFISPIDKFETAKIENVLSYQPREYLGLTKHESNLLGLCYEMPGFQWPSGKRCYIFCHTRAYYHYLPKIKPGFLAPGRSFQMKIINTGTINQRNPAYRKKLKKRKIKIPEIAFGENMPNFVTDITLWSDDILKDYGFIC
jgi:hypothetical protein